IVGQFAMSSLLICCTIIALQQIDYLRNRPLGFRKDQVISLPVGNRENGAQVLGRMRNMLAGDPHVAAITGANVNLGLGKDRSSSRSTVGFTHKGRDISTDWLLADYDYLKTLGIKLLSGREFDPAHASDSLERVIITESMAKMLGEEEPVGTVFAPDGGGPRYQVIGVIRDFHLYSLANELKPLTIQFSNNESVSYIFVRVSAQGLAGSMEKLKDIWEKAAPRSEFLGSFLDENVDAWYKDEQMLYQTFVFASCIAILLSCMGLFAVALMVIERRTKEIGVRKVMGAGIPNIVIVLSGGFAKMVFAALLIAIPLAWLFMQAWLNDYPYRIEITAWVFVLAGAGVMLIALLTVSFQSIRAALMNPVKSLRSE
ncbi:MAG TPA: FtsX-like permease family protein, partial [Anseongella sp.]|nr:FtsX-like permease family protein [Anseongella sp.]